MLFTNHQSMSQQFSWIVSKVLTFVKRVPCIILHMWTYHVYQKLHLTWNVEPTSGALVNHHNFSLSQKYSCECSSSYLCETCFKKTFVKCSRSDIMRNCCKQQVEPMLSAHLSTYCLKQVKPVFMTHTSTYCLHPYLLYLGPSLLNSVQALPIMPVNL